MPNWCNNNIDITGPIEKIRPLYEQAISDADDETGLLNGMRPMPPQLNETTAPTPEGSEQPVVDGHTDWYSWRVDNWSTKWEVSSEGLEFVDNGDGTASIVGWFDSAWAPPINAVQFYGEANPDVTITLDYHEPGMCFVGRYYIEDGESDDVYYDYAEATAATVRDLIGEDMDDNWGISDMMAEWEEENADEDA